MSGPEFIRWYLLGLGVAVGVAVVLRRWATRQAAVAGGGESVTAEDVAYLDGGVYRVIDVAVAGLLERERLRVQRGGRLHVVRDGGGGVGELEQAVLSSMGPHHGRSLTQVRAALAHHPVIKQTRQGLVERGLVVPRRARVWTTVPLVLLAAVGLARLVNGIALGRPVGYLTLLVCVTVVLIAGSWVVPRQWLTAAGRDVVAAAHGGPTQHQVRPALWAGAVAAVAVGGLAAFPDPAVAEEFRAASRFAGSGGSGDGGGGSSCGGGGGGGGCGG